MKILQLNNTGVVPYTIKRYFDRNPQYDIRMDIVVPLFSKRDEEFQAGLEGDGIYYISENNIMNHVKEIIDIYDIIHVNALFQYLPHIKQLKDDIKIVYTGHGREVRRGWNYIIREFADKITCVTPDLVVDDVELILNAPDPYHFKREKTAHHKRALIKNFGDPIVDDDRGIGEAKKVCKNKGYVLNIQNRAKSMYSYMLYPRYLENYHIFFDYKYLRKNKGYDVLELPLSYTALQFLQLGGIVYHHSGVYTELPDKYDYKTIMNRWREIYEELQEK